MIYNNDVPSLELKSPSWLCLEFILLFESHSMKDSSSINLSPNFINALEQAVMEGDNPVHVVVVEYQEGILCHKRI